MNRKLAATLAKQARMHMVSYDGARSQYIVSAPVIHGGAEVCALRINDGEAYANAVERALACAGALDRLQKRKDKMKP